MTERKTKKQADEERMKTAMRRLEELLQDPGPGITISPAGDMSGPRFQREGDEHLSNFAELPGNASNNEPGNEKVNAEAQIAEQPSSTREQNSNSAPDVPPHAVSPKPQQQSGNQKSKKTTKQALNLADKPAEDTTPPPKIAAPKAKPNPKATGAKGFRVFKPSNSSGGLFGIFLTWLLGPRDSEIKDAVSMSRRALNATFLFSAVINILMMAGPLFMLQVYDRVLTSRSFPTLVSLSLITAGLYIIIGMLELARSRIIGRVGAEIDQRLSDRIFEASLRKSLATQGAAQSALRELDSFRQFISGPAPITFFDAPWTPVYLCVIFMTHWILGVAATIGTLILLGLAWMSEQRARYPMLQAGQSIARSLEMAETGQRNAEAITAMGMLSAYRSRWQQLNGEGLGWQLLASDRLGGMSAVTKTMRLMLQSMMLAIAAGLAVHGDISAGSIIAATIIFGRALAPVEQIIGHWKGFIKARESFFKLEEVLSYTPAEKTRLALPRPRGVLEVQNVRVAAPETRNVILNGISFVAQPGQMLAVIGPSASGKSTLVRTIVGLWPPFSGAVMIDGARLDQFHPEDLGQYLGYLPQSVELFAGTVKQNISRFREDATDDQIVEAAKQAHAHELILSLPKGYDTELGNFGTYLSGGQRQRLALARALFGNPPLVVLDEPNSNLDRPGDEALSSAIDGMRKRKQTVILVSHRVQAIGKADLLLFIEKGQQRAFGPRNEVMKLFQGSNTPQRRSTDNPDAAQKDQAKPTQSAESQATTSEPKPATRVAGGEA